MHDAQTQNPKTKTNRSEQSRTGINLDNQANAIALSMHEQAHSPDVKLNSEECLVECGAWVVSDQSGLRQRLLQAAGLGPVFAIFHDLHTKERFNHLSDLLHLSKPKLLWIRLAGPSCGSGNKRDDRRASFLVRLALQQLNSQRTLIVEGNIRSQGWNLRPLHELGQHRLHETLHAWCRYQRTDPTVDACTATTRIWANAEIADKRCCMCWPQRQHFTLKQLTNSTAADTGMLNGIILQLTDQLNDAGGNQPESKTRLSALIVSKAVSTLPSSATNQTSSIATNNSTLSIANPNSSSSTSNDHLNIKPKSITSQTLSNAKIPHSPSSRMVNPNKSVQFNLDAQNAQSSCVSLSDRTSKPSERKTQGWYCRSEKKATC